MYISIYIAVGFRTPQRSRLFGIPLHPSGRLTRSVIAANNYSRLIPGFDHAADEENGLGWLVVDDEDERVVYRQLDWLIWHYGGE